MSAVALLYPVFVQVALTFAVYLMLGQRRFPEIRSGRLKVKDFALGQDVWPDRAQKVSNNFKNQFELPVVFYALVAFAMITNAQSIVMVTLAWVFVGLRVAHTLIHTGYNNVFHRGYVHIAAAFVLMAMWVALFVHVVGRG